MTNHPHSLPREEGLLHGPLEEPLVEGLGESVEHDLVEPFLAD
jgi:hypothetical protein